MHMAGGAFHSYTLSLYVHKYTHTYRHAICTYVYTYKRGPFLDVHIFCMYICFETYTFSVCKYPFSACTYIICMYIYADHRCASMLDLCIYVLTHSLTHHTHTHAHAHNRTHVHTYIYVCKYPRKYIHAHI